MNQEEVHKLLGGYATGTLTPEEQQALFAAALEDQELWNALAREQSLRDLLRDPAAKAQVLAALDAAADGVRVPWYRNGWWRPAAVAAAMAGIAVMAVVVTRKQAPAPRPVTVAELKAPAPRPESVAELKAPAPERQGQGARGQGPAPERQEPGASLARRAKRLTLPAQEQAAAAPKDLPAQPAPLPRPREEPAILAGSGNPVAAPPVPASPVAAPPATAQSAAAPPATAAPPSFSTERVEVQAQMPTAGQQGQQLGQLGLRDNLAGSGGAMDSRFLAPNARLLFYGNPIAADAIRKEKAAKTTSANSMAASARLIAVPAFHLGVRYSIVRKQAGGETAEVAIGTVLDAGDQVTLKIVPNDRGYLRVWELGPNGVQRAIASGTAQPLQPFEAVLPAYRSPGARQLYVQFMRDGQSVLAGSAPQSLLLTLAGANPILTGADEAEKATYAVNRASDPSAQQLVVPITLNYK